MKYATVEEATKAVLNISLWDGITPWSPPEGTTAVNVDGVLCDIGWVQQLDGQFTPPSE